LKVKRSDTSTGPKSCAPLVAVRVHGAHELVERLVPLIVGIEGRVRLERLGKLLAGDLPPLYVDELTVDVERDSTTVPPASARTANDTVALLAPRRSSSRHTSLRASPPRAGWRRAECGPDAARADGVRHASPGCARQVGPDRPRQPRARYSMSAGCLRRDDCRPARRAPRTSGTSPSAALSYELIGSIREHVARRIGKLARPQAHHLGRRPAEDALG